MTRRLARTGARHRAGFTLVELAVAVMIVGILAGIAIPGIQYAILKADAAKLVSDANTVRLATQEYLADNGSYPPGYTVGAPPASLAPYLPDNMAWSYKDVEYAWFGLNLPSANNVFHSRSIGFLIFNYSARREMASPMASHSGPNAVWGPTQFYYLFTG